MPRYEIKDLPGRLQDRGTIEQPFLHHISPGQRNSKSFIFHIQIGRKFHQMGINKIRQNHIYFDCKSPRSCKCKYHCLMKKK